VLDFEQAQRKALAEAKVSAERASGKLYTVADAVRDYLDHLKNHRKSADDTATKLKAYVLPELGDKRVSHLTGRDFEHWLTWAMKRKAQRKKTDKTPSDPNPKAATARRHRQGKKKKPGKPLVDPAELARRRKSTLNRVIAALKACLNHSYAAKRVASRDAWQRLRKFRAVDSARLRWLSLDEAARLLNACAPDVHKLASAALLTGCREGELLNATARDFDSRSKTLLVADSKSDKPRRLPLTVEGIEFFEG